MLKKFKWLQLFADGAPSDGGAQGGDATATPGATPDAAGQDTMASRLEKLGVPKDKLKRRAYQEPIKTPGQVAAAAEKKEAQTTEGQTQQSAAKPSFKELMKDPDYNREMQATVAAAKKKSQQAESDLATLTPALRLLAKNHGIELADDAPIDAEALTKAILDSDSYYEQKAIDLGTTVEVAKQIEQQERQKKESEMTARQQMVQQHMAKLEQQAAEMQKKYPGFDLRREMQNDKFVQMTAPGTLMSLEDAYFAVHRQEIMQATVSQTRQQAAKAIQAGQLRPAEGGVPKGQNASVQSFDWHNASKEQREAMRKMIRQAAANGQKIYPGQR